MLNSFYIHNEVHCERAELLITVLNIDVHKEGGGGVRVSVLG